MSIEKLKQVSEELNAAKAKVQEFAKNEGRAAIGAAFQGFFERFPKVQGVKWTQYTPHFNDGETCVFSVHEPDLIDEDGEDHYSYCWDKEFGEGCDDAFGEVWSEMDDDVLEAVFGDHVEITITRDEVTVEDYSHD
jgi:hypothetical protein